VPSPCAAKAVLAVAPPYPRALQMKLAACEQLGRTAEVTETLAVLLAVQPTRSMPWLTAFPGFLQATHPGLRGTVS